MNIQYFKSAWGDIKNSPGWFGKLCLLALLNFIPVFGQIVTYAYLYGWAREIAWGTHEPLPKKIFSNEDGKFWRRGWFVLVLTFVFALIPYIIISFGNYWQSLSSVSMYAGAAGARTSANPMFSVLGNIFTLVGYLGLLFTSMLAWVGNMRVSIYDRLSAGFQLGKIWKMVRHDTKGIFKIFGMNILVGFIFGIVLSIIISILVTIVIVMGVSGLVGAGYSAQSFQNMNDTQAAFMFTQFMASAGIVGFLCLLVGCFIVVISSMFVQMLVVRAVGYWTMQFDVAKWGGQDDPLPFEAAGAASHAPQQPPMGVAAAPFPAQTQAQQQWQAPQEAQPQSEWGNQPAQQPAWSQPEAQPQTDWGQPEAQAPASPVEADAQAFASPDEAVAQPLVDQAPLEAQPPVGQAQPEAQPPVGQAQPEAQPSPDSGLQASEPLPENPVESDTPQN